MIGTTIVLVLLVLVCIAALRYPPAAVIGFYGFLFLDPVWNWRWVMPRDIQLQKYVVVAMVLGFIVTGFRPQFQSRISKRAIGCVMAFLTICWWSAQQSFSPEDSGFFMGIVWKQMFVLVLAILLLDSAKSLKWLLIVAIIGQAYNAFEINMDYFNTGFARFTYEKWGSLRVDNNGYSIITLPVFGAALSLGLFEEKLLNKLFYFGVALLQIHQIMLLGSRGCMVAIVPMAAILIWKMPRRNGNVGWVSAAVLLGALLAGPPVVKQFVSSFATGERRDLSASSRFLLWKAGMRITRDYPLLGVGPNAARVLVADYYDGELNGREKALHNLFFDVSTGIGLPGTVVYFSLFAFPMWHCWRTYDDEDDEMGPLRLAVVVGLVGYLGSSVFSSGFLFESPYLLVVVGLCCANIDEYTALVYADEDESDFESDMSMATTEYLPVSDVLVSE